MNIIPTTSRKPAETCFVAIRVSDEGEPQIYGVYLDLQQALARAQLEEDREPSDTVRNLSTYGAHPCVLVYQLGELR